MNQDDLHRLAHGTNVDQQVESHGVLAIQDVHLAIDELSEKIESLTKEAHALAVLTGIAETLDRLTAHMEMIRWNLDRMREHMERSK